MFHRTCVNNSTKNIDPIHIGLVTASRGAHVKDLYLEIFEIFPTTCVTFFNYKIDRKKSHPTGADI